MFEAYEEREFNMNVNIEFTTRTELTKRMIEVSHAFGLGVSEEKHFSIYKDFKFGFNTGDLVYITGDSGGGKPLFCKKGGLKTATPTISLSYLAVTILL